MLNSHLKKLHWQLTENLKEKALGFEHFSPQISDYRKEQQYYYQRNYELSHEREFISSIINSDFIMIGDIHTFDQNIRNVLRVMRYLNQNRSGFILGIEFVHYKNQVQLDSFLKNQMTDLEFLEGINYHDSWRFPWNHYKILFEFIKKHNIEVVALNSDGNIEERDHFCSQKLLEIKKQSPQKPILLLFGELHIIPNKIPKQLTLLSPKKYRTTIIHQNIDHIYFENIQSSQVFYKFSRDEFCLINSPPWLKYESMIYWYENLVDDPDFDIHEYILDTGIKVFSSDIDDNFLFLNKQLVQALQLDLEESEISDFNLYDHKDIQFFAKKIKLQKDKKIKNFYNDLLVNQESFSFLNQARYFISNYSANRLIYLSGIHLHLLMLKKKKFEFKKVYSNKKRFFAYYFFVYCHSYLLSKFINPYRKCDLFAEFRDMSEQQPLYKKVLVFIEAEESPSLSRLNFLSLYRVAKILGSFIGELVYEVMRNQSHQELREFIFNHFYNEELSFKNFLSFKSLIFSQIDYKKIKKRFF